MAVIKQSLTTATPDQPHRANRGIGKNEVAFSTIEIQFYGACFVLATASCLFRIWSDGEAIPSRVIIGRCFSSGILGFGVVGLWLGRDSNSVGNGSFYFLAIAAIVGLLRREIQDQLLGNVFQMLAKKFGLGGEIKGPDDVGK